MHEFQQYWLKIACRHLPNAIELCRSPKSPKIHLKPLFWPSRSSKVIALGGNRKPVYDFILVINSNLGPISHRYWDTATCWPNSQIFPTPLSFSTLVQGDPLWIYGKALRFLKLESSGQPTVKIWQFYLSPFLTDPPVRQTDRQRQTDRRTDRIAMAKTRYSSTCCRA